MSRGGLLINIGASFATGGADTVLGAIGLNQSLQDTLINSTPEDLRIVNGQKLFTPAWTAPRRINS